jgi:all-trans-8'-apo-beta-carotenal 15,15'-oxygenase
MAHMPFLAHPRVNLDARATELHLLDARRIEAGPVATWRADVALPVGFHWTFRRG